MPRPHRRDAESGIHHVMNRGVDHQAIFFSDLDRLELGRGLARIHQEHGVTTLAYCLMGNHFHLLVRSPAGVLPQAMHQLTSVYSHRTNERLGRDGPLFRSRYHSIPVESDGYLVSATQYIHRNPLDLPDVSVLADYRWSSYRAYLGLRPVAPFLDVRPVLDLVGGPQELASLTEGATTRPSIEDVHRLVECAVAVDDLTHPSSAAAPGQPVRTVMILLADRTSDTQLAQILEGLLGPRSPKATRAAVRRAEARLGADPALARALAWVEDALSPRGARHHVG